ncbi:MFS transporter [bacterium]|nr:MFS transporter [bacterium]
MATRKPTGHGKWWVLFSVGISTFMSALDGSVVNTILPVVSRTYQSPIAQVEWAVTIYLLVISALLLGFGRLGDLLGHKPIYLTGCTCFVIGSALCGASPSLHWLVLFRALQAIGAAMLFANSPAILTLSFPEHERGRALGLQATMTYLGLSVGPALGGWLTDQFSWRAVFYINVPVGALALLFGFHFIPRPRPVAQMPRFDWLGAIAFAVGLCALLLSFNRGPTLGWSSPLTLGLFAVAFVVLGLFLAIEHACKDPMLKLTLFHDRQFAAASASAVFNYIAVSGTLFLLPFYLIQGRSFSPEHAGLILTTQSLTMALVAPLSGALSDRIGTRLPAVVGMLLLASGLFLLSRLGATTPQANILVGLAVVGLGTGIFISPNNSSLMGAAPKADQGLAGGVLATARNVGMVLGVGLAGAVFSTVLGTPQAASSSVALSRAVDAGLSVLAAVALLGCLTSAIRRS